MKPWKDILRRMAHSPRRFPVELVFGIVFFAVACIDDFHEDMLPLFVPVVALSFFLRGANRWLYAASPLLLVPLFFIDFRHFLWTTAFVLTYVLAALLLVHGSRRLANRPFANHVLHVAIATAFGMLVTGLLMLAVWAIVASTDYLFSLHVPDKIYAYTGFFAWFVVAPQVCCTFIHEDEYEEVNVPKVVRLILDFILSPALIIYTVILFAYFLNIVRIWDLPKGNVAYMVIAFVGTALVGRLLQEMLEHRHFAWFYDHLTWIALPPLVMFWVGTLYRIRLYSLTESRVYLLWIGALMTLFVGMLLWRRTRHFQSMATILGMAILLSTFVPGISAKSIGLRCQTRRFKTFVQELHLADATTGRLLPTFDFDRIQNDSTLYAHYEETNSIVSYLKEQMGGNAFDERYGEWNYRYRLEAAAQGRVYFKLDTPLDLGDYTIMLPEKSFYVSQGDGRIDVTREETLILEYPIDSMLKEKPQMKYDAASLHTYRNDSVLLVVPSVSIEGEKAFADIYPVQVFVKPKTNQDVRSK
ncbi:MAG: DUF4153 domain-containing protein [Bacteroidaceae bacterium]|nr:DUF4153 domain-containing protein [Bacteroidaceae bacterium]